MEAKRISVKCPGIGLHLLLLLLLSAGAGDLTAQTVKVSGPGSLQRAINQATPGTEIIMQSGSYRLLKDIEIRCQGTDQPGKRILIRAAKDGAVIFTGVGSVKILAPARYVTIRGFYFKNGWIAGGAKKVVAQSAKVSVSALSAPGSTGCRWTRNTFEMQLPEATAGGPDNQPAPQAEYLMIAGQDHEIDHNLFQHKNSLGRMLAIRGEGRQIATGLYIHHNYFYDDKDQGGANGAETLQFGLSGYSLSESHSLIEYNLFENCAAEAELVSVKASALQIRYNTFLNCPAQFTLRHGNGSQVYGNYFENTPGIRIYGDHHQVFSNYFTRCSVGVTIGNGDGEVASGAPLTAHDRPDSVLIAFNTLVDNKVGILLQKRKNGLGATYITVMDNVLEEGQRFPLPVAVQVLGPLKHARWKNNWLSETLRAGDLPKEGFIKGGTMLTTAMDATTPLKLPLELRDTLFAKDKRTLQKTYKSMRDFKGFYGAGSSAGNSLMHPLKKTEVGPYS